MALLYAGIRVELREVKLNDIPGEMLVLSSKSTVPVIQLQNGTVFEESLDIIDWALSIADPENWSRATDESLIRDNDEDFKALLDQYKYADRFPDKSQLEHRKAALVFLDRLENRLRQAAYLTGDRQGRVDICIMPFIRQFAGVDPEWFGQCELVALRSWLRGMLDSNLFQQVMQKYPVWQVGNEPVYL